MSKKPVKNVFEPMLGLNEKAYKILVTWAGTDKQSMKISDIISL